MKTEFKSSGQDPEALYLERMQQLPYIARKVEESGLVPLLGHMQELFKAEAQAGKALITLEDMHESLQNAIDSNGDPVIDENLMKLNGAYPTKDEQQALGIETMTQEIYGKCVIAGALNHVAKPERSADETRLFLERFENGLSGYRAMKAPEASKPEGPATANL